MPKTSSNTETRCVKSRLRIDKSTLTAKVLTYSCNNSKNVYNAALYFQRKWYSIVKILYTDCLRNLEDYAPYLSSRDVERLFKFSIANNDTSSLKKLYSISPSLIKHISDDALRDELKQVKKCKSLKPRRGRNMTPDEVRTVVHRVTGHYILDELNSGLRGQLIEFLPRLLSVFDRLIKFRLDKKNKKAEERLAEEVMEEDCEEEAESNPDTPPHFFPPSYLGISYMDLYVKMYIPSYKCISSQSAQQTVKKLNEAYVGFFESQKKGIVTARPPKYIRSQNYNLIYRSESCKVLHNKIRLSVGAEIKRNPEFDLEFLYLKFTSKYKTLKIKEVEIVPSNYDNRTDLYELVVKYSKSTPRLPSQTELINLKTKASIDLGVNNLVTLYSPSFEQPIIFSGTEIVGINKMYNYRVDNAKSYIKKKYKTNTSKVIQNVLVHRGNTISDIFHKISSKVIQICQNHNVNELIIGYNKNWKNKVNMGTQNNRTFYEVPFAKLVHMLFYKGQDAGIKVVENEESYTSKCDALGAEDVCFHDTYTGSRVKRGLFQSSKGVLVNADVNGAINIMRKYTQKAYGLGTALDSVIESTPLSHFCNPIKIKVNKKGCLMISFQSSKRGCATPSGNHSIYVLSGARNLA